VRKEDAFDDIMGAMDEKEVMYDLGDMFVISLSQSSNP